jgi:glycosyltransferase involved in cell wall biosynthesis
MEKPISLAMLARVVYPLHGFGGIERHVFHLVTHLARLGVCVHLYVQHPHREGEQEGEQERADKQPASTGEVRAGEAYNYSRPADLLSGSVSSMSFLRYDYTSPVLRPNSIPGRQINYPSYSWRLGLTVAQAVRRGTFDVVHSQGLCATGYGAIRVRDPLLQHTPFVANPHGLEEYRTPDWRKWLAYAPFRVLYSYGHRCADRVIATDSCTRDDVPRYLGVEEDRVVVIPSAIDAEECLGFVRSEVRRHVRERLGLDNADLVLLSVGRLERNKGYHILVAALARVRSLLPARWRWLLVGQGREEQHLRQQVAEAGLADHVTFVGRLGNDSLLHSLYEEVDLVIHPTLYEGSSLVTLEGMIHRKPMVASAVGGIPDKVFNGQNGYLVQPGSEDDLADKLRLALAQREQWATWGEESVRIVHRSFDWPVVAAKTKDLYEALLQEQQRRGHSRGMRKCDD